MHESASYCGVPQVVETLVSNAFKTLRDHHPGGSIQSSQLHTDRVVGTGACAVVERAVLRQEGGSSRVVAVKRIRKDVMRDEEQVQIVPQADITTPFTLALIRRCPP